VWLDELYDKDFLRYAIDYTNDEKIKKLLSIAIDEESTLPFYSYHILFKRHRLQLQPIASIIETLREHGYRASRSALSPLGLRTDCHPLEMKKLFPGY